MKSVKRTIVMCLMAMLCSVVYAGESNVVEVNVPVNIPGIAVWGQIDNSLERVVGLRVGNCTDYGVEFGGTALWHQGEEWEAAPDYYGVYVTYWIDELALVDDSDGYSGIEDLLHTLVARPYAVIEGLYRDAQDDIVTGIGAGSAFFVKEDIEQKIGLTIEYMTINGYEEKLRVGLRYKF